MAARNQLDSATEKAIIEQCRRQNFEAFGRIVDAYQARLFGFVKQMTRSHEEASDLTQEVFVRAFQSFGSFDGRSSLRTWLFRIAHNLCIDRARKHDRAPSMLRLDSGEDGEEPMDFGDTRWSPETIVMNEELNLIVDRGIQAMSEKLRSVLILHDREEMAYEEIATTLGVPIGTVKSRLFLARENLSAYVTAHWQGE